MTNLIDRLNDYVAAKRLKKSDQRTAILDIMINKRGHLTVDEIRGLLKKQSPDIGIATIYRTMKLFSDAGIVKELNIDGTARYEIITEGHHDHLVCTSCGMTVEITSATIEKEQDSIAAKHGFQLTDHTLLLLGLCQICRTKKKSGEKK
jgi:Fur family ferric uptake transcriptional regulator